MLRGLTITSSTTTTMDNMVAEPVKEKYALNIGINKWVSVDEECDVFIRDSQNGKRAFFKPCRWVKFVEFVPCIDKAVQRAMTLKPTNFRIHIGGGWYVSVNEEVPVVDFRKWYTRINDCTLRPSPAGISLSYIQWDSLKNVVEQMKADFEHVESCCHNSFEDETNCTECTPEPLFSKYKDSTYASTTVAAATDAAAAAADGC